MSKYCKTYNITCTCITCENVDCGFSARTRAEAEIARGVKLDKYGNELRQEELSKPKASKTAVPTVAPEVLIGDTRKERKVSNRELLLMGTISILAVVIVGILIYTLVPRGNSSLGTADRTKELAAQREAEAKAKADAEAEANRLALEKIEQDKKDAEELAALMAAQNQDKTPPTSAEIVFIEPTPYAFPTPEPTEVLTRQQMLQRAREDAAAKQLAEAARGYKNQGNDFLKQNDYVQARAFYRKAVEEDPTYYPGMNNLANTYTDEGKYSEAEPLYQDALEVSPYEPTLHFNMANSYYRSGKYNEAIDELKEVLRMMPEDLEAHLIAGVCYFRIGRYYEASRHFEFVVKQNPEKAIAYYNLHLTYLKMGNPSVASAYLSEAYRIDPKLRSEEYRRNMGSGG